MSDATSLKGTSLKAAGGRRIISRSSAEQLGAVHHLTIDVPGRRIAAIVLGKGKKATLYPWSSLSGFGPDAVMVADDAPPATDAVDDGIALLGARCLSELGNLLGTVDDATFDAGTGELLELVVGERSLPASSLLGLGSYACVVAAEADDVHPGASS